MEELKEILANCDNRLDIWEHSILLGSIGSIAHGTYKENSIDDRDIMGIVLPPTDYYVGLKEFSHRGTKILMVDSWDITIYEIKKFFNLLLKNNPNVLGMLWLPDDCILRITKGGRYLIENRNIFSSKLVYNSIRGYSYSQLQKMEHGIYQGYMGTERKRLVDKFGYDPKAASHLIRLLRMGIEFLNTGIVRVRRIHDRQELLDIKDGKWKLMDVKSKANILFEELERASSKSILPKEPDYERANEILVDIILNTYIDRHMNNKNINWVRQW